MQEQVKLFRVSNENATCGFEVDDKNIVVNAAPIIRKTVLGLPLVDAIYALTKRGWEIEAYLSDTKNWKVEE